MIKIGNKEIGEKPYIIAEAGVNHNGSLERAKQLVRAAASAGADAIKFQTYTADELVVKGTPKFWDWQGDKDKESQHDAYEAIGGFPYKWYPEVIDECKKNNIEFLSTAFSFEAADYLNSIGMKAFKVASSDMMCIPFLRHIAKFNKPILLSTGASTMDEVCDAVNAIKQEGNDQIVILHCTLKYPTEDKDANLNIIQTLKEQFPEYPIGISDHTLGVAPSLIAIAMGACVVEKHFTTDKTLGESADHWLSIEPDELRSLVEGSNRIQTLRGSKEKIVFPCENETRIYDKRSIVSKCDIPKGTTVTEDMITYKRPGTGIQPKYVDVLLGKTALVDIKEDTTLQWTHFMA